MATRILITGDYWHSDFKDLIAGCSVSTTLVTTDKLLAPQNEAVSQSGSGKGVRALSEDAFDLVAIAQSRQGQFDQSLIDGVKAFAGTSPVVMLLGSWCEGEHRSDRPAEGVKRVFWHQWQGRFSTFVDQLAKEGITLWHGPNTETDADRVGTFLPGESYSGNNLCVGISAWNVESYNVLSEAVKTFGWQTRWVERSSLASLAGAVNVICIDANALDEHLERRVAWLKEKVFEVPLVLTLNFPRHHEVADLQNMGITHVISKPFELNDLRVTIATAAESHLIAPAVASTSTIPAPKTSKSLRSANGQRSSV